MSILVSWFAGECSYQLTVCITPYLDVSARNNVFVSVSVMQWGPWTCLELPGRVREFDLDWEMAAWCWTVHVKSAALLWQVSESCRLVLLLLSSCSLHQVRSELMSKLSEAALMTSALELQIKRFVFQQNTSHASSNVWHCCFCFYLFFDHR